MTDADVVHLAHTLDLPEGWGFYVRAGSDYERLMIDQLANGERVIWIACSLPANQALRAGLHILPGDTQADVVVRAAEVVRAMQLTLRVATARWN